MLAGTELLVDVGTAPDLITYSGGVELDGSLYFWGSSQEYSDYQYNLWRYDPNGNDGAGKAEPLDTQLQGDGSLPYRDMVVFDGKLFFAAVKTYDVGLELWSFDPATEQLSLAVDINPGSGDSYPSDFQVLNDKLYFFANDGGPSRGLVEYDPAANDGAGGTTTRQYFNGGNLEWMEAIGDRLYFPFNETGQDLGMELWYYEPEANNGLGEAGLVSEINVGAGYSYIWYQEVLDDKLYFSGFDGTYSELWEYDPFANAGEGTLRAVSDFQNTSTSHLPSEFEVLDGKLYFKAYQADIGWELWRFDPTDDGSVDLVADLRNGTASSSPIQLTAMGDKLYFVAVTDQGISDLWQYDPHANDGLGAAELIQDPVPGYAALSAYYLTVFNGELYFHSSYGSNTGFFKYDPNANDGEGEAVFLPGMLPDTRSGNPYELLELNGKLYFVADDEPYASDLFEFDPDAGEGEERLRNITGDLTYSAAPLFIFDERIFFAAYDPENGRELWVYDPDANNGEGEVSLLANIAIGSRSGNPSYFAELNGILYFQAGDSDLDRELWAYDPLANSGQGEVRLVEDIRAIGSSTPSYLTVFDDKLYFSASTRNEGAELWVYDPAANEGAGVASMVEDLNSGTGWSSPSHITEFNGKLYFSANGGSGGQELWEYDPLAAEGVDPLRQLADIRLGNASSYPSEFFGFNGILYFSASDGETGNELWQFDPTANQGLGVVSQVADMYPGVQGFSPRDLVVADGKLFMQGATLENGWGLWVLDPSAEAGADPLTRVDLIYPGEPLTNVNRVYSIGEKVYFTAIDETYGRELFVYDPNPTPIASEDSYTIDEDTVLSVDALNGVLSNDSQLSETPITVSVISDVSHGVLVFNSDGSFTYTPDENYHGVDSFTYEVSDVEGDSDIGTVLLTVTSVNDIATIDGQLTGNVTEDGPLTTSGVVAVQDVDTGEDQFQTQTNAGSIYGYYSIDASGNWTYELDNVRVNNLTAVQSVVDTFLIESLDGSAVRSVTITIFGNNDPAIITGDINATTDEDNTNTLSGSLSAFDPDQGESSFTPIPSIVGDFGTFGINSIGSWAYILDNASVQSLPAGQSLYDVFVVRSVDGTEQTVTIQIDGRNDTATIGGVLSGNAEEDVTFTVLGTATISDIDQGEAVFQPQVGTSGSYGTFSIDANGNWTYNLDNALAQSLAADELVDEWFTIDSVDGSDSVQVKITVKGQNDAATIRGKLDGSVSEDNVLSTSGTATISDADDGEAMFRPQSATSDYGSFSLDASGNWVYNLENTNVQHLPGGKFIVDFFTIHSLDGSASHEISIPIMGANDAAVIYGDSTGATDEDATAEVTGKLNLFEIDAGENQFEVQTNVATTLGTFSVDNIGNWSYRVDNSAVQNLAFGQTVQDTFTVRSLDGTEQLVTIDVNGQNDAPIAIILSVDGYRFVGNAIQVAGSASDIDAGSDSFHFAYEVFLDGDLTPVFSGSGQDLLSFQFTPQLAGEYRIKLTVSDSEWGMGTEESTITIGNASNVDFELVKGSTSEVGDIDDDGPAPVSTLHEWEDATGELWLTIDDDLPGGPLDFNFELHYTGDLMLTPQLVDHLGIASWSSTSGEGGITSSLALSDVDLASYEVGDRVLLAKITYPKNVDDVVGLPMDQGGAYPQPLIEHGVQLVSAHLDGAGQVLTANAQVPGKIAPVLYDANDDGRVGLADFARFIANYGDQPGAGDPDAYRFDYNQDGRVGISDFALFISHYGRRKSQANVDIELPVAITGPAAASSISLEGEPVAGSADDAFAEMIVLDQSGRASITPRVDDSYDKSHSDFGAPEVLSLVEHEPLDTLIFDAALCEITLSEETQSEEEVAADLVLSIDWAW